ncbi:MAG TPA: hypothetical protein VF156_15630 [Agromyces sp.]
MDDRPPIRALDDVRPDPHAELREGVAEALESVPELAKMLAGEWAALTEEGMPAIAAAVLVGQRWRMTA